MSDSSSEDESSDRKQCGECRRLFSQVGNMKVHLKVHTGEKPQCTACDESLSHLKSHLGRKKPSPFSCTFCAKTFSFRISLTRHVRIHTGERPFDCTECDKKFRQKISLTNHLRTHGKIPQLRCDCCSLKFSDTSNLRKHKLAVKNRGNYSSLKFKTSDRSRIKSSHLPGPSKVVPAVKGTATSSVRKLNRGNFGQTSSYLNSFESGGYAMGTSFDNLDLELLDGQVNHLSSTPKSVYKCCHCPQEFQARTPYLDHVGYHAFDNKN